MAKAIHMMVRVLDETRAVAIQQTVRAVEDLAARNARKQRDIDRAQIALLFAALTLLGGVFAGLILTSGR
mgnify:CR=1 FL=1